MTPNRDEQLETLDREAYDWLVRFAAGGAQAADLAALKQWAARSPAHQGCRARNPGSRTLPRAASNLEQRSRAPAARIRRTRW
jgi:ferric-dicitrate binding protein FerR (iron transport regulator)